MPRSSYSALLLLTLFLPACGRPAPASAPASAPGNDTFTLDSRATAESRRINVHTPAGYASSPERRYPVLYMPDGGMQEDFPHVVKAMDSLIALGEVRPFLVVGIENTERRRDMTGPTRIASDSAIAPRVGGSAAFRAFIRDELMPEIRTRYRTTGETAIVGESLAGLFIMETFLNEPALFNRYIALSPSLWWNEDSLLRAAPGRVPALAGLNLTLFLAAANEDNIAPQTDTLARLLQQGPSDLKLLYRPMPDQEHNTIYLAASPTAFREVLGKR